MKLNKTLLILCVLCGFSWLLFTSLSPTVDSFPVEGVIEAWHGEVYGAKLRYTQDRNLTDVAQMKEIDVQADGRFSGVLNIRSYEMVYFYVVKDGYTISTAKKVLEKRNVANNIGTIHISSLYHPSIHGVPELAIYSDECLNSKEKQFKADNIVFENLRVRSTACKQNPSSILLSAKLKVMGNSHSNDAYFALQKQKNGQAFIADASRR